MIASVPGRIATISRAAAPPAMLAAAAAVLLWSPPSQSSFYPQCPFYAAFHLACPGCGGTRALAALLHGNIREAMHFNALITLLCPFVLSYGAVCYRRFLRDRVYSWPRLSPAAIGAVTVLAVLFAILRNLAPRWS